MTHLAAASVAPPGPVLFGTIAEFKAYSFGERMIARQAGMIARTDGLLREIGRRQAASEPWHELALRGDRQAKDYARRARLMNEHRDGLWALAERGSAVLQ